MNERGEENFTPNYTGKFFDESSGLYYFNARWYDCELGRFTSQDPARDGVNWWIYCGGNPITFVDPDGLFYYKKNNQEVYKKTTVFLIRDNDGLGNKFDSSLYIRKEDVFGNVIYSTPYIVGANCAPKYDGINGSTTPDGVYYLSNEKTKITPLYKQIDGTTNSNSYKNVLSLRTKDLKLTKKQRDMINEGDRLLHSDEKYNSLTKTTKPYSRNKEPYGAGCIISHTQSTHDKMIKEIMDGVPNPESVVLKIYSLNNMR